MQNMQIICNVHWEDTQSISGLYIDVVCKSHVWNDDEFRTVIQRSNIGSP